MRPIIFVLAAFLWVSLTRPCLAQSAVVTAPVVPVATAVPTLIVRGTVEVLDPRQNSFILRVQTHTRIVYVTPETDVMGLEPPTPEPLPVHLKERVTVGGFLQPNGTVLAWLLTSNIQRDYQPEPGVPNRIVFGVVSATSNKLRGRDIKVRDADGTETKIKVGRGLPITRAGRPISVHALGSHDEVRVVGTLDGTDLTATRIDALPPVINNASNTPPNTTSTTPAHAPAATPDHAPIQPGL